MVSTIEGKRIYRRLFWLSIAIGSAYLLYLARGLLVSLFIAVILTYLLNPVVNAIDKRGGGSRVGAILLTYLALFFVLAGIFLYVMPRVIEQLNKLSENIPLYIGQAHGIIHSVQTRYDSLGIPEGMKQVLDERMRWFEERALQIVRDAVAALIGTAGYVFKIILAPVIAFYFLKDLDYIKEKSLSLVPEKMRGDVQGLLKDIDRVISSFLRGYFLIAALVGGMTAVVMAVLGVDFALMLGLFAGITELIPYFGPVIGAVPAVCLAVLKSKWLGAQVAIAFFIIHQVEGNIISPKIYSNRVGLHPLVVIFSLLAGGELYGLTGMLLAVPVAAMVKVLVKFLYLKAAA
ncbi:MAG TPA: AI-2E family transporter [Bacillota bacterium]|nr:AI-2E family transporter [Bacillota bacterium]